MNISIYLSLFIRGAGGAGAAGAPGGKETPPRFVKIRNGHKDLLCETLCSTIIPPCQSLKIINLVTLKKKNNVWEIIDVQTKNSLFKTLLFK